MLAPSKAAFTVFGWRLPSLEVSAAICHMRHASGQKPTLSGTRDDVCPEHAEKIANARTFSECVTAGISSVIAQPSVRQMNVEAPPGGKPNTASRLRCGAATYASPETRNAAAGSAHWSVGLHVHHETSTCRTLTALCEANALEREA